jgi:hypothetical protein
MKCEICANAVGETFLKKIVGAYVKDDKGKMHLICFECQEKYSTKAEQLKLIK